MQSQKITILPLPSQKGLEFPGVWPKKLEIFEGISRGVAGLRKIPSVVRGGGGGVNGYFLELHIVLQAWANFYNKMSIIQLEHCSLDSLTCVMSSLKMPEFNVFLFYLP